MGTPNGVRVVTVLKLEVCDDKMVDDRRDDTIRCDDMYHATTTRHAKT